MFEKTLHGGNIAAAFAVAATTADLTFAGGAATAISAALSGTAIYKNADKPTRKLSERMAALMDEALAQSHLTDQQKRVVAQMLGAYQPSNEDIATAGLDPALVAQKMVARIEKTAIDPAHKSQNAMDAFSAILVETLRPVLTDPAVVGDMMPAIMKELLARTDQSGQADRLRDEGITEKAIIRQAQRFSANTDDVGQAWLELQNAMDVAVRFQQEGKIPSNHGDFVDEVIQRVAKLAAEGAYPDASDAIDAALADEDAAHAARKTRLLDSGIEIARMDNQPEKTAQLLVAKLRLDVDAAGLFDALRILRREWYERGRDGGLNFESTVAIHLAEACRDMAQGAEQRGTALDDLGIALAVLGKRESSVARLEAAVVAFEAALEERPRDKVPLDWAMTQNNLGNALLELGRRESDVARLDAAVAAYEAALEERTRDKVPLDWAATQNNLGTALRALGERESGVARLQAAVTAYGAALEEWTRDKVPLDWAMVQNNLGNALLELGARENSVARLEAAVTAYQAALEEWTRDRVPLNWATTQNNLGYALQELGQRENSVARLEAAVAAYEAALEERTRDKVPLEWAMTQNNLGTALLELGARESGVARLDAAVTAYAAALEERARDRVPLDWASTQFNLCTVELAYFDKTGDAAHLDRAQAYVDAAIAVFVEAQASRYIGLADEQIAAIAERRGG